MTAITATPVSAYARCKPNISGAGRRTRRRFGWAWVLISMMALAGCVAISAPWFWRVAMFLPVTLASLGFLQARRNTCVARASEGTFEHEDFSKTKASIADATASRRTARGITRDALLIGFAGAALAAATSLVR